MSWCGVPEIETPEGAPPLSEYFYLQNVGTGGFLDSCHQIPPIDVFGDRLEPHTITRDEKNNLMLCVNPKKEGEESLSQLWTFSKLSFKEGGVARSDNFRASGDQHERLVNQKHCSVDIENKNRTTPARRTIAWELHKHMKNENQCWELKKDGTILSCWRETKGWRLKADRNCDLKDQEEERECNTVAHAPVRNATDFEKWIKIPQVSHCDPRVKIINKCNLEYLTYTGAGDFTEPATILTTTPDRDAAKSWAWADDRDEATDVTVKRLLCSHENPHGKTVQISCDVEQNRSVEFNNLPFNRSIGWPVHSHLKKENQAWDFQTKGDSEWGFLSCGWPLAKHGSDPERFYLYSPCGENVAKNDEVGAQTYMEKMTKAEVKNKSSKFLWKMERSC